MLPGFLFVEGPVTAFWDGLGTLVVVCLFLLVFLYAIFRSHLNKAALKACRERNSELSRCFAELLAIWAGASSSADNLQANIFAILSRHRVYIGELGFKDEQTMRAAISGISEKCANSSNALGANPTPAANQPLSGAGAATARQNSPTSTPANNLPVTPSQSVTPPSQPITPPSQSVTPSRTVSGGGNPAERPHPLLPQQAPPPASIPSTSPAQPPVPSTIPAQSSVSSSAPAQPLLSPAPPQIPSAVQEILGALNKNGPTVFNFYLGSNPEGADRPTADLMSNGKEPAKNQHPSNQHPAGQNPKEDPSTKVFLGSRRRRYQSEQESQQLEPQSHKEMDPQKRDEFEQELGNLIQKHGLTSLDAISKCAPDVKRAMLDFCDRLNKEGFSPSDLGEHELYKQFAAWYEQFSINSAAHSTKS